MKSHDKLEREWQAPSATYRGAPFWSWNSKLEPERLQRQIEIMHEGGMGGFFMHSRYGLKTPYLSEEWFECVGVCLEKARQLEMKAYLYDEDRWPSGPAGGFVTREHPELRLKYLVGGPKGAVEAEGAPLAAFQVELDDEGRLLGYAPCSPDDDGALVFFVQSDKPTGWTNDGGYIDTMSHEPVREFLRVTHEQYYERFGEDFGGLVPAIFTDEPNYGHGSTGRNFRLNWTNELPAEFKARRGYDLLEKLPELLFLSPEGGFNQVQHDYHQTVTELFVEHFTKQIGTWCGQHHIALTGHMLMEGGLLQQLKVVGACMPHYEYMQWPGIDLLTDQAEELLTAKQCSSVAAQLGKERVLSELYGCTGWDWPLEGHKFIGDWQYAAGINLRCPHLTHYSLAGGAKRDYPASIRDHSPWWPYYHKVEDYFGRLGLMLTQGTPIRDVLVIHPIESAWGLYAPGSGQAAPLAQTLDSELKQLIYTLSGAHYDWDFADESLLARYGYVESKGLTVGLMTYKLVLVPPSVTLRASTLELLERFQAAGGKVLFVARQPSLVDGRPEASLEAFVKAAQYCELETVVETLESLLPRRLSVTSQGKEATEIWTMLRDLEAGQLLFLQSHNRQSGLELEVALAGVTGPVVLWDALSGERWILPATRRDGKLEVKVKLPPTGTALLTFGLEVPEALPLPPEPQVVETLELSGPFEYELTELNTLPLDYCQWRVAGPDGVYSEPKPVLAADKEIRARFGLGTRLGHEHQPWYLYAMGTVDTEPREEMQMRWTFHITDLPTKCFLVLETPQDYKITVNGWEVDEAVGYWVDDDLKTIDIVACLKEGENEIVLSFWYRPDMELEDMYLLGDFGVVTRDGKPFNPHNTTLVKLPEKLELGSWVQQGLPFYGAAVKYKLEFDRPKETARVRLRLPEIACTAAAVHVNGEKVFPLVWAPFEVELTDALKPRKNTVEVEVIGGRKNILGPLHTPWERGTGPGNFSPDNGKWRYEYYLTDHGLTGPIVLEHLD